MKEMRQVVDVVISGRLEALPVHNGWAGLIILPLGDPHLLEGGQGSQDGTTDPYGVLPLRGSNDLDLHGAGSQGSDFLLHTVSNTWVHGGATREHSVGVQVLTDVHITLHDGVVSGLMDTSGFHTQEGWLEESLRAPEPLIANGDDLTVRQLIGLLQGRGGGGGGHLLLEVQGNIAELLLDVTDNLSLSGCGEAVTTLGEDLHEVVSEISTSQIQTEDGVGQGVTLVDGYCVGNTISGVQHNTCGTTGGVQRQHSLDGYVHGWGVEGLKHDLGHLFPVGFGVEGSLCEQDGMLLWGNTELIVECVMPDLLHIIPVCDDTVLNWVLQGEDTSLALGLITDIAVLLTHAHHDTLMTGASNDGWEYGSWGIVSGETGFAHAGAIVYYECCYVVVT